MFRARGTKNCTSHFWWGLVSSSPPPPISAYVARIVDENVFKTVSTQKTIRTRDEVGRVKYMNYDVIGTVIGSVCYEVRDLCPGHGTRVTAQSPAFDGNCEPVFVRRGVNFVRVR
jgi:hypothetical protein